MRPHAATSRNATGRVSMANASIRRGFWRILPLSKTDIHSSIQSLFASINRGARLPTANTSPLANRSRPLATKTYGSFLPSDTDGKNATKTLAKPISSTSPKTSPRSHKRPPSINAKSTPKPTNTASSSANPIRAVVTAISAIMATFARHNSVA